MAECHSLLQLCEELPSFFFWVFFFLQSRVLFFFTVHAEAAGQKGRRCLMLWPQFHCLFFWLLQESALLITRDTVCLVLQQEGRTFPAPVNNFSYWQ